ncbi:MAG: hypothetical protein KatS3mg121_0898 [Gammaproteobacteria bacterium]|nr:MAG: hypothetical protein KatS3mg121_0898 [Gammaproteobacteria bacterium]
MFGWVMPGSGKPGICTSAISRPSGTVSTTPKSSALPTQAETQAGLSPASKPVDAHIALLHPALDRVELRGVVGTHPGAVAATEADVGILDDRAVLGVLGVGPRRATLQAHRVVAVVAGHRDVQAQEVRVTAAFHVAHRAETQVRRQVVLLAAGGLAGVATDAVVGGEKEGVLLVAVRVRTDVRVAVDLERFSGAVHEPNRLSIAVDFGRLARRQLRVIGLVLADREQGHALSSGVRTRASGRPAAPPRPGRSARCARHTA